MRLFGPMILLMLIEIALFITVGGEIGLLASLAVIFGTGILGSYVIRRSSEKAAVNLRAAMSGMRSDDFAAGDHALVILAGVLLILPGFLGDILGLVLLIPPVRSAIRQAVMRRVQVKTGFGLHPERDVVIDAEFIELDPEDPTSKPPRRPSGWTKDGDDDVRPLR